MTSSEFEDGSPRSKRRKLTVDPPNEAAPSVDTTTKGLDRPISPPFPKRRNVIDTAQSMPMWRFDDAPKQATTEPAIPSMEPHLRSVEDHRDKRTFVPSPIRLTHIQDMAPHQNVDAVSLKDILGDPMIKECWNFNFLFDLDFVMKHFDSDVRGTIKVKIVHGFWKKEDERRVNLMETAKRYPNIELLSAYIPDPFGTHHSKMLVLIRHDDRVQVIIHTANMISRDWGNMTQAVWSSPLLPMLPQTPPFSSVDKDSTPKFHPIGSGERFKVDLLKYIGAYERRLGDLSRQLAKYDFSAVKAAFIGSAPSRQKVPSSSSARNTSFGWLGLQEILSSIPISNQTTPNERPHIIIQISSIATSTPAWHTHFQSILACHSSTSSTPAAGSSVLASAPFPPFSQASTFFSIPASPSFHSSRQIAPKFNIIFPTPTEIRASLDAYASGASIHMKLSSTAQQKQLSHLLPFLCHWNSLASVPTPTQDADARREALRGPAAPHIKTYVRFSDERGSRIDWAMLTSANLSTQAWGGVVGKGGEVWVQSWETGVVVWPELFAHSSSSSDTATIAAGPGGAVMVPVFGRDMPIEEDVGVREGRDGVEGEVEAQLGKKVNTVVGFRMPYDLPLSPYAADDEPWCASSAYKEVDWKGQSWGGY